MDEDNHRSSFPENIIKPRKLLQVIVESGRPSKKQKVFSGDADLPVRDELGERRRKHDLSKTIGSLMILEMVEAGAIQDFEPEENGFYKEAKQMKEAKKDAKFAKYSREFFLLSMEEDADGKRRITNMMEKNRGLTPQRTQSIHGRNISSSSVIRRKDQVRDVKSAGGSYRGEATGIRTGISRSIKIQ